MTIKEKAKEMGISEQAVRIAIQQGRLPGAWIINDTGRRKTYYIEKEVKHDEAVGD